MGPSIAIVADRLGWEERLLVQTAPRLGLRMEWVNDESMCLGDAEASSVRGFDLMLMRSRSYTRGGLIASLAESAEVPTLNTAAAIRACENKAELRALLRAAGVPIPDFRLVLSRKDFNRAVAELGLPAVLKRHARLSAALRAGANVVQQSLLDWLR